MSVGSYEVSYHPPALAHRMAQWSGARPKWRAAGGSTRGSGIRFFQHGFTAYSGGQIKCALPFSERSPRRVLDELCGPQKLHRTVERHGKPPSAYQLCEGVLLMLTKRVRMCHMALHALTDCTPHISQYIRSFRVKLRISGFFVSIYRSVREPDFFDHVQRPLRRSFRKRQRAIVLAATVRAGASWAGPERLRVSRSFLSTQSTAVIFDAILTQINRPRTPLCAGELPIKTLIDFRVV